MKKHISFIGCGNMASAIISGLDGYTMTLFDRDKVKYNNFKSDNISFADDIGQAVKNGDIVFLCVKPQNFNEILPEITKAGMSLSNKIFVSIAAGITIKRITDALGKDVSCVRTIPNTPLMIGHGVTALCRNDKVNDRDFSDICRMFSNLGEVFIVDEEKINAVTAATSSAPAYVYLFVEAITESAQELGIDESNMLNIICNMVKGSCDMILKTGKTPQELIKMVKSPNGTTERALNVFEECDFKNIIHRAMTECTDRAAELAAGK